MALSEEQVSRTTPADGSETTWLRGRRGERITFIVLAVIIWPIIAVAVVGGYGFLVWMSQLIVGPPGPPGG